MRKNRALPKPPAPRLRRPEGPKPAGKPFGKGGPKPAGKPGCAPRHHR